MGFKRGLAVEGNAVVTWNPVKARGCVGLAGDRQLLPLASGFF